MRPKISIRIMTRILGQWWFMKLKFLRKSSLPNVNFEIVCPRFSMMGKGDLIQGIHKIEQSSCVIACSDTLGTSYLLSLQGLGTVQPPLCTLSYLINMGTRLFFSENLSHLHCKDSAHVFFVFNQLGLSLARNLHQSFCKSI